VFYYLLLFADRLVAWTAHTQAASLPVQFRGDYERALNLGLLAFIFQVGWVQYSVAQFYRELAGGERRFAIHENAALRESMVRFYWARIVRLLPFAAAGCLIPAAVQASNMADVSWPTAAWSMVGYPLLIVGLWNASLLFGLRGAVHAAAAAGIAAAVDLVSGYLLSRIGTHHQAVIGFFLGALTFALLSAWWSTRSLRRVDALFYAASQ
jgi:hypothetical protein